LFPHLFLSFLLFYVSNSRKRALEYAAETSPPTADMRQKKKGKRMKYDLSKKTNKSSKVSKTTKKKKSESMETSKTVAVLEEMTNKRINKKKLIIDM